MPALLCAWLWLRNPVRNRVPEPGPEGTPEEAIPKVCGRPRATMASMKDAVEAAYARIWPYVRETPVEESATLADRTGATL
jgi:hypothetical protein